jgi:hypothetical protein
MPATLEDPASSTITIPDRPTPQVGDTIRHRDQDALVIRVRPTGLLDIVVYQAGRPLALDRVEHHIETGWSFPGEAPPPPPTLEELMHRAEAEGKFVPRTGTEIVYLFNAMNSLHGIMQDLHGRRARVLGPIDLRTAEIELFVNDRPPLDPDDVDEVACVLKAIRHDPTGTFANVFQYPAEHNPRGMERVAEARPRWRCTRPGCSRPADPGRNIDRPAGGEAVHVCDACFQIYESTLAEFFAGDPVAAVA